MTPSSQGSILSDLLLILTVGTRQLHIDQMIAVQVPSTHRAQ